MQLDELQQTLSQKIREVELIQAELKLVKDFRRKRVQLQRELEEVIHLELPLHTYSFTQYFISILI